MIRCQNETLEKEKEIKENAYMVDLFNIFIYHILFFRYKTKFSRYHTSCRLHLILSDQQ